MEPAKSKAGFTTGYYPVNAHEVYLQPRNLPSPSSAVTHTARLTPRLSSERHTNRKQHVILPAREIADWSRDVPQYSYEGKLPENKYAENIPAYFYKQNEEEPFYVDARNFTKIG